MNLFFMMRLIYILINVSLASASTGVHLSYNSTSRWENMKLASTASINSGLELTRANITNCCSWATYNNLIPLLDDFTSMHASFLTHFSFFINSTGPSNDTHSHGIVFFLSPYSLPNSKLTCGGNLGLFPSNNDKNLDISQNQVVAVEFDTYHNDWDSEIAHVGIDVNSIYSVVIYKLSDDILSGTWVTTWVSYNASDQTLNVSLNYLKDSE